MNARKAEGAEGAASSLFEMLLHAEDPETGRKADEDDFVRNVATFLNAENERWAAVVKASNIPLN